MAKLLLYGDTKFQNLLELLLKIDSKSWKKNIFRQLKIFGVDFKGRIISMQSLGDVNPSSLCKESIFVILHKESGVLVSQGLPNECIHNL